MSVKSMKDLEKVNAGAIFTNAFLSIAIFFIVVGNLFKPLTKDPALAFVILPLTLAFMYAIARTTPTVIYKIYTLSVGLLSIWSLACAVEFVFGGIFKLIGSVAPIVETIFQIFFVAVSIAMLYFIWRFGNKVFRAKYEKRFAAEAAQVAAEASKFKTCPHCAETILVEAKVCKHCGRDV